MPKPKRSSPGVGREGSNITDDAILTALATEVLDQEKMTLVRENRKRNRKRAEANGVPLSDLDELYKRRDDPVQEIRAFFQRRIRVFSAFFTDAFGQTDMFSIPMDAKAAFGHAGLMAGLKGETPAPPPDLSQDEREIWLEAHTVGADRRKQAQDEILAEAAGRTDGKVTDGTAGAVTRRAAAGAQAAADFKEDNQTETVLDGIPAPDTQYFLSGEPLYKSGRRAAYVNGKTVGTFDNDGTTPVYADHAEPGGDPRYTGDGEEPGFEMSEEERQAQIGRQQVQAQNQASTEIDPAEVEAAAAKLVAGGFTDGAKKKGGGTIRPAGRKAKAGA